MGQQVESKKKCGRPGSHPVARVILRSFFHPASMTPFSPSRRPFVFVQLSGNLYGRFPVGTSPAAADAFLADCKRQAHPEVGGVPTGRIIFQTPAEL
jgi:hypothetical protein